MSLVYDARLAQFAQKSLESQILERSQKERGKIDMKKFEKSLRPMRRFLHKEMNRVIGDLRSALIEKRAEISLSILRMESSPVIARVLWVLEATLQINKLSWIVRRPCSEEFVKIGDSDCSVFYYDIDLSVQV